MKKIISLFMSVVMLLSVSAGVDLSAYAATLTTGKCGDNVTYSFDSETGTLTIGGAGKMYDYSYEGSPFFYDNNAIKSVIIEFGVTSIGDSAFAFCDRLTSITIPNSVTSIGNETFASCVNLTSITIPDSVTNIGGLAFEYCINLTSLTIPSGVTSINASVFYGCDSLLNINVNENNKNYSSQSGVLFNKNKTTLIYYPLGKKDKTYTIPNGVTNIGDSAFFSCDSLTIINIPNSVTSVGRNAFSGCISLTNVTIPDGATSIGNYAFSGCESLTSITIPDGVTSIGNRAFDGCNSLISINVSENNKNYSSQSGVLFNKNKTTLICYPFGKKDKAYTIPNGVTNIGSDAFYCSRIESITIPDSVKNIGDYAFAECYNLASITIPDSVASIGNVAFGGCDKLSSVTFLSKTCNISNEACIPKNTKILGFKNSSAIKYAKSHGYSYSEIECGDVGVEHKCQTETTKATLTADGKVVTKCQNCGFVKSTKVIYKVTDIKLSKTQFTYNGKAQAPSVTVKDSKGNTLKKNTDYTVSYSSGRKNVGKYTVTITFKGNYSGKVTKSFTIKPKGTTLSGVTAKSRGFTAKWKKQASQTTGYQIQYSTSSKFTNAKSAVIGKNTTLSKSITGLSKGKKYYVRVRTYKTVNGTKFYSNWSSAKSVTVK